MENESDEHRLSHSGSSTRLRFCLKKRREDKPADSKHCQSHGGSLLLVRPIIQVRVEHSLPDNGRIPGGARLHVTSRPGIKEGSTSKTCTWASASQFQSACSCGLQERTLKMTVIIVQSQYRRPHSNETN